MVFFETRIQEEDWTFVVVSFIFLVYYLTAFSRMRELNLFDWFKDVYPIPITFVECLNQKNNWFPTGNSREIHSQIINVAYFLGRDFARTWSTWPSTRSLSSLLGRETLSRWFSEWWIPKRVCGQQAVLALGKGHFVEVLNFNSPRPVNTILPGAGKVWVVCKVWRAVHYTEYLDVPWECPRNSMLWNQGTEDRCLVVSVEQDQPIRSLSISSFCYILLLFIFPPPPSHPHTFSSFSGKKKFLLSGNIYLKIPHKRCYSLISPSSSSLTSLIQRTLLYLMKTSPKCPDNASSVYSSVFATCMFI